MHFDAIIDKRIQHVKMPENLAVGMMVREQRNKCRDLKCPFDYFAFAFGESPFQVPTEVSHALAENSAVGGYTEPGGIEQLKIAATIYTNVTTPVQHAAVKAYTASSGIDEYFQVTRSICKTG